MLFESLKATGKVDERKVNHGGVKLAVDVTVAGEGKVLADATDSDAVNLVLAVVECLDAEVPAYQVDDESAQQMDAPNGELVEVQEEDVHEHLALEA